MQHKVIGYFCYTEDGEVICDGDACIIAGSEEAMQEYLSHMLIESTEGIVKKTRFGEIMSGLVNGGAYAFDEDSYRRILPLLNRSGMNYLPSVEDFFSVGSRTGIHFIRVQTSNSK